MTDSPARPHLRRAPVRVVIVDDSPLMRRLLSAALAEDREIEVVGSARDAEEAGGMIARLDPDVVTLDVALPGMSGVDFLRRIMEERPRPIVMVSSLTAEGAETSLTALQLGAVDVVEKPRSPGAMPDFRRELCAKVRFAATARPRRGAPSRTRAPAPAQAPGHHDHHHHHHSAAPEARAAGAQRPQLIALGASTGGVSALGVLLAALPDRLPPIVIVQHMPEGYPERFATRLAATLARDVAPARSGEALGPGMIRLAPGDRHLAVAARPGRLETRLVDSAPVSGHRPSADVLFESVARACGAAAVGVVMTGMGRDGAIGLLAMRRAGATCVGQGPESCVVYGMPRAAREMGAISEEAELDALPGRICHFVNP